MSDVADEQPATGAPETAGETFARLEALLPPDDRMAMGLLNLLREYVLGSEGPEASGLDSGVPLPAEAPADNFSTPALVANAPPAPPPPAPDAGPDAAPPPPAQDGKA